MNIILLRTEDPESCCNCEYANMYIPYYTYPWSDPYCSKGHGKCSQGKVCNDYKNIYEVCGNCKRIKKEYNKFICTLHDVEIEFNKKTCDDFIK